MNGVVTVETSSRWEASSLLRKLRGHNAYVLQVGPQHWLVRSLVSASAASVAEIEELLSEWAAEERTERPTVYVDTGQAVTAQT